MDKEARIAILYFNLGSIEKLIGELDGKKLELIGQQTKILDELAELGEEII